MKEVVVLGDMNAQNEEVRGLCGKLRLREAGYQGCSWGKSTTSFIVTARTTDQVCNTTVCSLLARSGWKLT